VIVIDTEGHDAALIDALDFAQHGPRVLHFEHALCPPAERLRLYSKLLEHGYELVSFDGDTTAYKLGS
jgi:hypothetical protein